MTAGRVTLGTIPVAVAFAFGLGFARTSTPEPMAATAVPAEVTEGPGQRIWLRDCAICHGEDAAGTPRGPSLQGVGAAGVDLMVSTGRMPLDDPTDEPRRGPPTYGPAEIEALVSFTGTFIDGPAVPEVDLSTADVATGGKEYRTNCASCHQMAGQGGILPAGRNIPPMGSATPTQVVEAMRSGPSDMPVFPEAVIDQRAAADIAAYVEELHDPRDAGGWALGHWGPVPEGAAALALGLVPIVLLARRLGDRNPVRTAPETAPGEPHEP